MLDDPTFSIQMQLSEENIIETQRSKDNRKEYSILTRVYNLLLRRVHRLKIIHQLQEKRKTVVLGCALFVII